MPTVVESNRGPRCGSKALTGALCRRALEALHVGLLFIREGETVWANPAAVRLLGADTGLEGPWSAAIRAASRVGHPTARHADPEMRPLGTIRTPGGPLRLCGVSLPVARGAGASVVLVALERAERERWPQHHSMDDEDLRCRFRLTRQELHVARLLVKGLSNVRLAEALGISPNTARIHTERVLRKLGVHSRTAVAAALACG